MNNLTHQLEPNTGALCVFVPGDILSTTADTLRDSLFSLLESAPVQSGNWNLLKLDLTQARMVDSVGLNLIVSIVRALKARNAKVQVIVSSANIQRTFSFTRLDRQVTVIKIEAESGQNKISGSAFSGRS